MPTTTNNGWTTPADSDPFKDGALAIRTLGNGIDTSTGNGLLTWTAYTPTLGNVTLGVGGTSTFHYAKLGKTTIVRGIVSLAGAGTVAGFVNVSLPVAAKASVGAFQPLGQVNCWNGSSLFSGVVWASDTTNARLGVINAGSTYAFFTDLAAAVPFAWNTGTRQMFIQFTYEAAQHGYFSLYK